MGQPQVPIKNQAIVRKETVEVVPKSENTIAITKLNNRFDTNTLYLELDPGFKNVMMIDESRKEGKIKILCKFFESLSIILGGDIIFYPSNYM